jgi:hypothetical protein
MQLLIGCRREWPRSAASCQVTWSNDALVRTDRVFGL